MNAATSPSPRTRPGRTTQERQAALDAPMATLQAGAEAMRMAPGWQAWLTFAARMPSYSVSNQLLIVTLFPSATAVAGYTAWTALGRQVRRGETALRILAPTTRTLAPDDAPSPRGDDARCPRAGRAAIVWLVPRAAPQDGATVVGTQLRMLA